MDPIAELAAASLAFVGTHFALSHPLRAPLVARLGEKGFLPVYSLVAFATLGWMILAFRAAPTADLPGSGEIGWIASTLLTIPALLLFLGSLRNNPALPAPGAMAAAAREPAGVFAVTRHPMMWGFALWGIAHILVAPRIDNFIFSGSLVFLALVGRHDDRIDLVRAGCCLRFLGLNGLCLCQHRYGHPQQEAVFSRFNHFSSPL